MWIPYGKPEAIARVSGGVGAPCLFGTVKFYQMGKQVLVVSEIYGMPKNETGFFALHIHEGGSCQEDFTLTGSHYNPENLPHPMHAGDLPPLLNCDGRAFSAVLTGHFTIKEIIGRTAVIHEGVDDFTSQPAGNAGQKIACGLIVPCMGT